MQAELERVRLKRIIDQKNFKKLDEAARERLVGMKRKKEMGRMLLPDAPPSKKRRQSPERYNPILVPGTPTTPPAKIQTWYFPITYFILYVYLS